MREKLAEYDPSVVPVIMKDMKAAWAINQIDDNTFKAKENSGNHPELYRNAVDALRKLGKTDAAFTSNVINRYNRDPSRYINDAKTFSNELHTNPAMCAKVIELAREKKIQELNKMATNPATYMAQFIAPVAPASEKKQQEPSVPASKPGKSGTAKPTKPAAAPLPARTPVPAQAPAMGPIDPGEVWDDENRTYTADEARAKFGKIMADPKNAALAKKISEKEGLRAGIEKEFDKDPQLVRNFLSKGNRAAYLSFLEKGDVNGFMQEFSGQIAIAPMPDMSNMMVDMKGMFGSLGGMFPGMFEGSEKFEKLLSGFMKGLEKPAEAAAKASAEIGVGVLSYAISASDLRNQQYAHGQIRDSLKTISTTPDSAHKAHEMKAMAVVFGSGDNLNKVLAQVKDGSIDPNALQFTVSIDSKTGAKYVSPDPTSFKPRPKDYAVERVARDAEQAAGVERDEFGFVKLPAGNMPAGLQPSGAVTSGVPL